MIQPKKRTRGGRGVKEVANFANDKTDRLREIANKGGGGGPKSRKFCERNKWMPPHGERCADAEELWEHPTFGHSPSISPSLRSVPSKIKDDSTRERGEHGRVGPDK